MVDWGDFAWNWTQFCPTGLKPFANETNDLLPCFQEILLQLPVYTLFAAISAYNFGNQSRHVVRNGLQLRMLSIRTFLAMVLALLPVAKVFAFHHQGVELFAADLLVVSAECIMWVVHSGECAVFLSPGVYISIQYLRCICGHVLGFPFMNWDYISDFHFIKYKYVCMLNTF